MLPGCQCPGNRMGWRLVRQPASLHHCVAVYENGGMNNGPDRIATAWPGYRLALAELALFLLPAVLKAHLVASVMRVSNLGSAGANAVFLLTGGCLVVGLPVRWRRTLLGVCAGLTSLLLFADRVHYRAFGEPISLREIGHVLQLTEFSTAVFPYIRWEDLWLAIDLPVWIFLLRHRGAERPVARLQTLVWVSVLLVSAGASSRLLYEFILVVGPDEGPLARNRPFTIKERGLFNYHLLDAVDCWRVKPVPAANPRDLARVRRWFASHQAAGGEILPFGAARGCNLIFIQVESLEAFLIGLRTDGQEITPKLNEWARRSFHFSRFFPQTSFGSTSDAEFCALNSLLPTAEGVVVRSYDQNDFRSLPAILRDHGYSTVAMSVCRPSLWNMANMHQAYGFQRRYYYDEFARGPEMPQTILDDRFLEHARELLRRQPRPFFAHLLTLTGHTPFTWVRPEHQKLRLGALEGTTLADYLHTAHFVDAALGHFLDGLEADGLGKDCVVFIYGDHHALPLEERERLHAQEPDAVGLRLDESLRRRVPLFVIVPGRTPRGTVERVAGQIDLAPTTLHLLGIPRGAACFLGQNLFREEPPLVYFRNGAFATGRDFFHSPDGTYDHGECETIDPGTTPDTNGCARVFADVQERIWVSDRLLEQNLIPILLKASHEGGAEP